MIFDKLLAMGKFCWHGVIVTVLHDCQWKIMINNQEVSLQNKSVLEFSGEVLFTCSKMLKLLVEVQCGILCIGTPDEKFFNIRDRRQGKFLSRSGKHIVLYIH